MNTTELATLLGVTTNTVARWEIGDRHPRFTHLQKLNELLKKAEKEHGFVLNAEPVESK